MTRSHDVRNAIRCGCACPVRPERAQLVSGGFRQLGIEKPYGAFCFARNRLRFARRHFSFPQILSVTFVFAPLSAVYCCTVALRNRRPEIAWAYLRGTFAGIFALR